MIYILPIWRSDILFISFKGWLEGGAFKIINTYPERRYSSTLKRYYIPYSVEALQKITVSLKEFTDVDVSEWSDVIKLPPPIRTKVLITIPALYRETMVKKRYSTATIGNYLIQFRFFLEFISPVDAHYGRTYSPVYVAPGRE